MLKKLLQIVSIKFFFKTSKRFFQLHAICNSILFRFKIKRSALKEQNRFDFLHGCKQTWLTPAAFSIRALSLSIPICTETEKFKSLDIASLNEYSRFYSRLPRESVYDVRGF